jgi:hypothetical protein
MVVHDCNPSTQEAEAGIRGSRPAWITQSSLKKTSPRL